MTALGHTVPGRGSDRATAVLNQAAARPGTGELRTSPPRADLIPTAVERTRRAASATRAPAAAGGGVPPLPRVAAGNPFPPCPVRLA